MVWGENITSLVEVPTTGKQPYESDQCLLWKKGFELDA